MKKIWNKIFPAIYGLIIYVTLRVVNDTMGDGFKFWERPFYVNFIEFLCVILVGYLFIYIFRYQERKYFNSDVVDITFNQIRKELFIIIGIALLVVNCTIIPMAAFTDDGLSLSDFVQINVIPTLYIVLYFTIRRGNFYVKAFVQSKLKLQQIETDRLTTELDFLREQFSPHFLFNGLNNIYFQKSINYIFNTLTKFYFQKVQKIFTNNRFEDLDKEDSVDLCSSISEEINTSRRSKYYFEETSDRIEYYESNKNVKGNKFGAMS